MIVESFACLACGAPKTVPPDSLIVYCDNCEALVAYDASRQPFAHVTQFLKAGALHRERTRRWLAASGAMAELLTTDPEAAARYAPVQAASMALAQGTLDPTAPARAALDAWRAYYQWVRARLSEHAEMIDPEVLARSIVRSSLRAVQALLGEGVIARVRHELFGDTVVHACATSGAPLEGEGLAACRYCGAVARVEDDPWLAGVLALWAPNEQRLVQEGKLDTLEAPLTALQIALAPATLGTGKTTPEGLLRALAHMIPWVPRGRVVEAMLLLRGSAPLAAQAALTGARRLIDTSWKCDPSLRPVAKGR
jgi:hypothetical protein